MLKVSANQMDYAAATSLYSRSLRASEDRDRQALTPLRETRSWPTMEVISPAR